MEPHVAARVLWVRAVESTAQPSWSDADAAWATRTALRTVGSDAPDESFVVQRADAVLQRLVPRTPALAPPIDPPGAGRRGMAMWLAVAVGLLAGVLADRIGAGQRINLLAPPVWVVIVWNLLVYAGVLWHSLARKRSGLAGAVADALLRRWQRRTVKSVDDRGGDTVTATAVWAAFVPPWSRLASPLWAARMSLCLHLAAGALGVGLLGGMYLRGLVLDYRVGWQSTFLDAQTVQPLLSTLLAPATLLTAIAVPDVAGIQALQVPPGASASVAGANDSAAPWIHLYAAQLMLLVVLPRLALALAAALRSRRLANSIVLPLTEPYFRNLLVQQKGGNRRLRVWPYALPSDAARMLQLRALIERAFGTQAQLQVADAVAFGDEDDWHEEIADGEQALVLFDLSATPEAENHGRFVQQLAAASAGTGAPVTMLIDEAGFKRRFAADRLQQRRQAWQTLADNVGGRAVFVDLQSDDHAQAVTQLQGAA
ncbi:MAG: DUF2868 domain-containing protein [Rubrivivax sp.]